MVKSPKIRHSKTSTEPVTIDLGADEVSRVPPESAKSSGKDAAGPESEVAANQPEAAAASMQASVGAGASPVKQTGSVPPVRQASPPAGKSAEQAGKTTETEKAEAPQPDTAAARPSAGSAGPSPFGRDASAKPSASPEPKPAATASPPPYRPAASQRGAGSIVAAGLIGGLVVLGGVVGAGDGGLVPAAGTPAAPDTQASDALRAEIETLRDELAELRSQPAPAGADAADLTDANARIESVSVLVEEMRAQLAQLSERAEADGAGGDAAALEEFRTNLSQLEERMAALPAEGATADAEALRAEMARVEESVRSAAEEAAASASETANAAASRIEALERSLAELSARVEEQDQMPSVALAIAASALKAAIDRGAPFLSELETFAGLAPEAPEIAELRSMAATGVPTRTAIAAETDAAAVRIIEAGRVIDPQAGMLDRLWASAQSLVTVRPIGQVQGEDVPAIVARVEAAIQAGDYERAIAEYDSLPQDAQAAGAEFIAKVRARHAADRLAEQTLSAALRA